MWLGLLAVVVALSYALIKFVTTYHMRRLRDSQVRLVHDLRRERQRLQAIDGKLQVERARCGAVQQNLATARRFKEDLFGRLRLELPSTLLSELRECVDRHPVPEPAGALTAHQLHLADKVTAALGSLSLLLLEFRDTGDGGAARTVLQGDLVQTLTDLGVRWTGPEAVRQDEPAGPSRVATAFDEPVQAVGVVRSLATAYPGHVAALRGVLVAGVTVTEFDQEHVNRLFARTINSAAVLLEDAPDAALVLNDQAYELLRDSVGIEIFSEAEKLWVLRLGGTPPPAAPEAPGGGVAAGAAAPAPADPDRGTLRPADPADEAL